MKLHFTLLWLCLAVLLLSCSDKDQAEENKGFEIQVEPINNIDTVRDPIEQTADKNKQSQEQQTPNKQ